jgi:hypothetical protein
MNWQDGANKIKDKLVVTCPYAQVSLIDSINDFINKDTVAQTIANRYTVLISTPDGDVVPTPEPLLTGVKRKIFAYGIAIVVKTDAKAITRIMGKPQDRSIFEVQDDVVAALEHSNLDGLADNKAGLNFEDGWTKVPTDNKAITVYFTTYTVVKTEK